MHTQVLINVEATDIRVAILEDAQLVELFVEKFSKKNILGNVYKGRVEAIVPGLKAAFVNIGLDKNAFLHFQDVLQEYALPERGRPERLSPGAKGNDEEEAAWSKEGAVEDDYIPPQILPAQGSGEDEEPEAELPRERPRRGSRQLKVGDTLLVQVIKEPLNDKGPRVTSYLSIPGRYLVMMPFSESSGGVSRKIVDNEERKRLREILRRINVGPGAFIIRTAGLKEEENAIFEDFESLQNQWKVLMKRNLKSNAPAIIHDEAQILGRLVRDTLHNEVDEILIDDRKRMKELIEAGKLMAPRMVDRIHLYESAKNIFDVFEVEKQFQKALRRKVWMKSGGQIVIDETEALTAIDVNSGKFVGSDDQDSVILRTNLEACRAVSRQLRLRDLGGLIVVDFIDMTNRDHQAQVLREFRNCLKRDNAKYAMTGFSEFGLVEMTRKRVRMSLAHAIYTPCPYCEGTAKILGEAQTWKLIKYAILEDLSKEGKAEAIDVTVHSNVRTYIETEAIEDLKAIANRHRVRINITSRPDFHHEQYTIIKRIEAAPEREKSEGSEEAPAKRRGSGQKRVESAGAGTDNLTRQP